jgi:aspartyl-tRNA(Asn)/glutamyl-tRNA(Gln) amidotransferase subunit A
MTGLTAAELSAKLQSREISAQEAAEAHFDRIETIDGDYGAYLLLCREEAMKQAEAAQAMLDAGDAPALCGIPYALKDNIVTKGITTTCASKVLEGWVPPYSASVYQQMQNQGMVLLGKTNLDEFAMGTSTENSAYQLTRCPWDPHCSPGGSSGGSAAAVSAELAPISFGSDTGGSVRQPASLCGVVGFKPTYGRISRYGLVAFASSLDQIGPFGRTVEDTSLAFEAVAGHDRHDSTSLPNAAYSSKELKSGSLKGLKMAIPKELFGDEVDPGVKEVFERGIKKLQAEGAIVSIVSLPSLQLGVTTYYIIAPAEASSNLGRYDGIRFGPRIEEGDHNKSTAMTRGQLFGHEVKLRIMVGTYALSAGYYDAYYHRAQQVRGLMADEMAEVMKEHDVIISPTSPVSSFRLEDDSLDQMALKMLDLCTIPANMGGFPSISIPCGADNDMPVGLLLTGPVMGDEKLLQAAWAAEQALGFVGRRPPIL